MRAVLWVAGIVFLFGCGSVKEPDGGDADADADGDSDSDGGPCDVDEDCGEPTLGGWSSCEAAEVCATTGQRTREVGIWHCVDGACESEPTTEQEECERDTEDASCGADLPGDWSACNYASICSELGAQSRTVQIQVCRSGACTLEDTLEELDCTRETDGDSCEDEDPCTYNRVCTDGTCNGAVCAPCPC